MKLKTSSVIRCRFPYAVFEAAVKVIDVLEKLQPLERFFTERTLEAALDALGRPYTDVTVSTSKPLEPSVSRLYIFEPHYYRIQKLRALWNQSPPRALAWRGPSLFVE